MGIVAEDIGVFQVDPQGAVIRGTPVAEGKITCRGGRKTQCCPDPVDGVSVLVEVVCRRG